MYWGMEGKCHITFRSFENGPLYFQSQGDSLLGSHTFIFEAELL